MEVIDKCTLTFSLDGVCYTDDVMSEEKINGSIDRDSLASDTRDWLVQRIEERRDDYSQEEARLLGRHLYEAIFRGQIRSEFEARIKTAKDKRRRLRLELVFGPNMTELARLPWEFLYLAQGEVGDGFLAGEIDKITLTRFIGQPLSAAQIPEPVDRPVKVLLAVCVKGSTKDRFRIPEIRELDEWLERAEKPGDAQPGPDVELCRLPNPTFEQLRQAVQGEPKDAAGNPLQAAPWFPDVVHIVGEGKPGAIVLSREAGSIASDSAYARGASLAGHAAAPVEEDQPVEAQRLKQLFDNHVPKLVVLQTCYSDKVDGEALYTAAQSIVGEGVPAVLAMQFAIARDAADRFARLLYTKLLEGDSIDVAVTFARLALRDRDVSKQSPYRAFGTPVIYLGHDKPLVKERVEQPAPRSVAARLPQQPADKRECPRCEMMCASLFCWNCGLRFKCPSCAEDFENPVGSFCGTCGELIQQQPWRKPAGGGRKRQRSLRVITGENLAPPKDAAR